MTFLFYLASCIIALLIIALLRVRILKREKKQLIAEINQLIPYSSIKDSSGKSPTSFVGIANDLQITFQENTITISEADSFIAYYSKLSHKVNVLSKGLRRFKIDYSPTLNLFMEEFCMIDELIKSHNAKVLQQLLATNKGFFDTCLDYPLDSQQRKSIVSEELNCLVVSSAGSGKTSSIVGKVKYLLDVKKVDPRRILLISYTNKAAAELTERIAINGLRGYTFHKLAIDLITHSTGCKPSICDRTDRLFIEIYRKSIESSSKFRESVVKYFIDFDEEDEESEEDAEERERKKQLSEQKRIKFKALLPDMDGNEILVKSSQEQKLCFALSSLDLQFRYEEPYEFHLADQFNSQYRPDFSIYYKEKGETRRIYLEHFGVDEHGQVPAWFAKDKNMSYDEANQKYNDGITWKMEAHQKFGTQLLTTSSADFSYLDIRDKLKDLLTSARIPFNELPEEELYDRVLPRESKQEKAFIRLVVTFATLVKSSCKSIEEILQQASLNRDKRTLFVVKNILQPVYAEYLHALKSLNQIDFTDAILQATQLCYAERAVPSYDYIIVDEFQDISVDRYNFLKALRQGAPPAKLYCVGDDWQSIYRFSGSDMSLFSQFENYFGPTDINKIETTYRFGEPLVGLSSRFIERNSAQLTKNIRPFNKQLTTELAFYPYDKRSYTDIIEQLINSVPSNKSIFLLGRYSFDDYHLSYAFQSMKREGKFYYRIAGREIEFLTVHKSKGLEADYVIILQCNYGLHGFPSLVSDDPILRYVLTENDYFPYGEERRLFYVAITRAKNKTMVLYDSNAPSKFVEEFLYPNQTIECSDVRHRNANKRWTRKADQFLITLHKEKRSIKYIAAKMGRSQTSIAMRLKKLNES